MRLPKFVPILSAFAARIAGRELGELLDSPPALARAVADTQTVLGHDGVLCLFDPSILVASCICGQDKTTPKNDMQGSGLREPAEILATAPLANLLESIQPLRHHLQDRALIFVTFTGPILLYTQLLDALGAGEESGLCPDYVVDVVRSVVRSALEMKVDGIALIEQTMPAIPSELLRCHRMVRKLADFYDAGFLLFKLPGVDGQELDFPAHCVFDLTAATKGIAPVMGKLEPGSASDVTPITTGGDVPEATTVEEMKTLLHEFQST